jgi:hypothetical protein
MAANAVATYTGTPGQFTADAASPASMQGTWDPGNSGFATLFDALSNATSPAMLVKSQQPTQVRDGSYSYVTAGVAHTSYYYIPGYRYLLMHS